MNRQSLLLSMFLLPTVASTTHAGVLAKVVSGLKAKSSSDDDDHKSSHRSPPAHHKADSSSASGAGDHESSSGSDSYSSGYSYHHRRYHRDGTYLAPVYVGSPAPYGGAAGRTNLELELGVQDTQDSEGAFFGRLSARSGDFAISLADTSYFERLDTTGEFLRLHAWRIGVGVRVAGGEPGQSTSVWFGGGFAGAAVDDVSAYGAEASVSANHHIGGSLGVHGELRGWYLQDGIRALEYSVGVAASIVRLSYRVMDYNTGPPLRGPMLGIALHI